MRFAATKDGSWKQDELRLRGINRVVNEQIAMIQQTLAPNPPDALALFVCECTDRTCLDRLEMELALYDATRADPHRYVVAPNHENPMIEMVAESGRRYAIVETFAGVGSQIAEDTDPRRRASFDAALGDRRRRLAAAELSQEPNIP